MLTPSGSFPSSRQNNRLTQIGNICAQWSELEYIFAITIWVLLNLEQETGKIVTGGLDMLPRVNMAINLARHRKAPKQILEALITARKSIQDGLDIRRNRAVHGVQFIEGDDLFVEVHRGKGGREKQLLPDDELAAIGREIHNVSFDLRTALLPYLDELVAELQIILVKMRAAAADTSSSSGS